MDQKSLSGLAIDNECAILYALFLTLPVLIWYEAGVNVEMKNRE